jgi:hypothetical protein
LIPTRRRWRRILRIRRPVCQASAGQDLSSHLLLGPMEVLLVLLLAAGCLGLPHAEVEEGESACLHKPCLHGVCQEDVDLPTGYRCFCEDGYTGLR